MTHGSDFWNFIPFILSTTTGRKFNWMRVIETIIGALIISFVVSYITVQKMEVEINHINKTLDRHEGAIDKLQGN